MNPLLQKFDTPFETIPFDKIKNEHFLPAIQEGIAAAKQEIEELKNNPAKPNFSNTIEALERAGKSLELASSVLFNLNSAETSDEIQKITKDVSPLLTAFRNDINLDEQIFKRVKAVYDQKSSLGLDKEEEMLLEKTYKGFVRNGSNLSESDKVKLRELDEELAKTALEFGENLLHETNSYVMFIDKAEDLKGLPEDVVEMAAMTAKEKGQEGKWAFTLHAPSYLGFMTYADNRAKREELFKAFGARCFKGDQYDNQEKIKKIVKLRDERAKLLGYKNHSYYVLEERMAESPEKVKSFLDNLLQHAKPVAEREMQELKDFAKKSGGSATMERWDFGYYSEKLKMEKYAIDDELLRPYFQLEKVIDGMFEVAKRLYKISFTENSKIPVYHPEVKAYEVRDENRELVAIYYADYFPRPGKRNGAWMTSFKGQYRENGIDHRPHVSIVCNFTKPTPSKPSLLTFDEVTTLFHEFGHALHGMLAEGHYESLTGTNVYWDFVELPSQIMENWVYEKECLDIFAAHYQTGEKIPMEYISKIKESANFMGGYASVRQISFGHLDMAWHSTNPDSIQSIEQFEQDVLKPTQLMPIVPGTNMSCSFSHIFQGGYSSGYYSYKWAEVLDADAFELFLEKGIFDMETAASFRKHVLSAGGREHPMELYKRFRGKEPAPEALLRRSGLVKA